MHNLSSDMPPTEGAGVSDTTQQSAPTAFVPSFSGFELFILLALCFVSFAPNGWAKGNDTGYGISGSLGSGARGQSFDAWRVGAQKHGSRTWLNTQFGQFTGYWDLSFARFDASDLRQISANDSGTKQLWAIAITPVLRWQFSLVGNTHIAPFMELAVGLSYLSDSKLRTGKIRSLQLGSHFQFEDRGVIGLRFGRHWELAYQRLHYSNLNLANENHGLDVHLGILSRRF